MYLLVTQINRGRILIVQEEPCIVIKILKDSIINNRYWRNGDMYSIGSDIINFKSENLKEVEEMACIHLL